MAYNKLILLLILSTFMVSCGNKTESGSTRQTEIRKDSTAPASVGTKAIFETFTSFPPEIDGCSCYYSLTTSDFKSGSYIMAANFGQDCFIKVDGKMQKLKLIQQQELSQTRNNKVYSGAGFLLTIEVEKTGSIDETWQQKGVIRLEQKNKDALINSIIGECGC